METFQDFALNKGVEISEIADHAATFIHRAADRDLQRVVVAVAIRIIALSVRRLILRFRHGIVVQPMRSREHITAGGGGVPSFSQKKTKKMDVFLKPTTRYWAGFRFGGTP